MITTDLPMWTLGEYGSNSDGAVFKNCAFGKAFMNDELDVPQPTHLPNYPSSGPVPYCFVADEAFPLCCDLMRPFASCLHHWREHSKYLTID